MMMMMMMKSSEYGDESLPCMYTSSNHVYLSGKTCYNLNYSNDLSND